MKKRIFTLIELLVVVAIISILMTILLPALRNAKVRSKSINCLSNIRQTGQCLMLYSNDWDGFLPEYYDSAANVVWGYNLIKNDYAPIPTYMEPHIFICPLQRPKVWINTGCTQSTPHYNNATTYGMRTLPTRIRVLKINSPSNYFILGDSRDDAPASDGHYQWYYLEIGSGGGDKYVHLRHYKKANVLYGDFSARATGASYFDEIGAPYIDQDFNP